MTATPGRQIRTCGASVAQRCSYSKESFVTFPSISHVALTVTDLEASAAWYERLLCVCPVLNEDAGPFWHTVYPLAGGTLLGLHRHRRTRGNDRFDPLRPASTTSRSPAPTATNSRPGRPVSTSSASATAASSTRPTDPACRSRTPTATPLSSSRRRVTSAGEGLDEHDRRPFGRTGLVVSPLSLGTMEFGSKIDEVEASKLLDAAIEAGVNVVDTANVYAAGRSEEILGRLIGSRRDQLIVATKFSVPTDSQDPNSGGTSRRTVIAACEASLRRLGTDYIDVYYIHRPFTQTAIDETLRALDDLVRGRQGPLHRLVGHVGLAAGRHVVGRP